jgi:hypothetical protein
MIILLKYKKCLQSFHPLIENNFSIHYTKMHVKSENEINALNLNIISYKILQN